MFSFELHENEKVIKIYRQAESLLIKPAVLVLFFIYVPIWFLLKYGLLQEFAFVLALWTLAVLVYAVNKYFLWLLGVYLITTKRVIAVHYTSLFRRQTEEIAVASIANIRQINSGIFSMLLKFGDVELEGGGAQPLKIKHVAHPELVKDAIWKAKEQPQAARPMPTTVLGPRAKMRKIV